ncbi:MAG: hypothetical protein N3C59_05055 [Azovibrio sp.]|nr:hypothetical protein [Azovibrio sp.]
MSSRFHPAARLLLWLFLAIAIQLLAWPALLVLALLPLLSGQAVRRHWGRLIRRTRILLLTLFLVFAYGLPGPTPADLAWLPSYAGLEEAALHLLRLLVLLGSLAWLLVPLGHRALMGGLWFLLRPLQRLGLPMDRSVVRLALVLEYIEHLPARPDWREWLLPQPEAGELAPVCMVLPPWSRRDTVALLIGGALLGLGGALWRA